MKPNASYKKLQSELQSLTENSEQPSRRSTLRKQLETEFMATWGFAPDRLRLGSRLCSTIRSFRKKDGNPIEGFDHYTFYTAADDQRVIVTQPYGKFAAQLKRDLTLDKGIAPEIIVATQWAFYYPGHADMIVLKFPFNYAKALEKFSERQKQDSYKAFSRQAEEEAE